MHIKYYVITEHELICGVAMETDVEREKDASLDVSLDALTSDSVSLL